MKCYKTHKTARRIAIGLSIIPIILSVLGIIHSILQFNLDAMVTFFISIGFLYLTRFLIGRNLVSVCISANDLIVKKMFYPTKSYKISQFSEIALITLLTHKQRSVNTLGSRPEALGRLGGNMLLSMSQNAGKNTYPNKQLAVKMRDGSILTLNSNYINDSIELIDKLKELSGLAVTPINIREYSVWKKGLLQQYRSEPYPKSRRFLALIKPYYKAKYVFFPPIIIFVVLVLGLNIWFNWTHYQFKKISLVSIDNAYFVSKESPIVNKYAKGSYVDIFSNDGKKLLTDILKREKHYGDEESDIVFYYSFYPYENPYYLSRIINVDDDKEAEILFKDIDQVYHVYDFNRSTLQFETKPIASLSKNFERYIKEVKGYKRHRWSYYVGELYLAVMVVYMFALLIFHSIFAGIKKNVTQS